MMQSISLLIMLVVIQPLLLSCQPKISPQQSERTMHNDTSASIHTTPEYSAHLNEQEYNVLVNKATDRPGDYGYTNFFEEGVYHCRACGAPLYKSESKFHSGCGWPAFDAEIPGAVRRISDNSYGMIRTEIVCMNCGGHLGHVFEGEHFTQTNTRHCVNTSSIIFHPKNKQTAYIALGQFHEAQALLQQIKGVLYTETGYANSNLAAPVFADVESGKVQAIEVVKVEFDPHTLSYEGLLDSIFTKDNTPQQSASQFAPVIFSTSPDEATKATAALSKAQASGKALAFTLKTLEGYAKAESEHQNYILKHSATARR